MKRKADKRLDFIGKLGVEGAIAAGTTAAGITGLAVGIAALSETTKRLSTNN